MLTRTSISIVLATVFVLSPASAQRLSSRHRRRPPTIASGAGSVAVVPPIVAATEPTPQVRPNLDLSEVIPVPVSAVDGMLRRMRVFLFTDIEGSTALWEKAGRAFRTALDQHDRLVRAEAARHGGQELTESGDGFLIAFGEPSKAVDCAVDVQRAMAAPMAVSS